MNIYISGISGTAMGPLALMAKEAGLSVCGSDQNSGPVLKELTLNGIDFYIGPQDGSYLRSKLQSKIDWFIYTSALPKDHKELALAREQGIKCSKRDEFISFLVNQLNLKMVAVAGTHGKTTTTAGIIYLCQKINLPVSWLVGTTLGFAPAGKYVKNSQYLVYEADEYDRNFLAYQPFLSVIPSISYDHPDTYPTPEDYAAAFAQFISQSQTVIQQTNLDKQLKISGPSRRFDLALAAEAVQKIIQDYNQTNTFTAAANELKESLEYVGTGTEKIPEILDITTANLLTLADTFPGVGRRMEKIADGVYSDYAHHPEEIKATLSMATEEAKNQNKTGVVAVYEPHQNLRQHEVKPGYKDAFKHADKLFWLPTFLTREDPNLKVLTPADFIQNLDNLEIAEPAELNEKLYLRLKDYKEQGYLLLLMSAGPADAWFREKFAE